MLFAGILVGARRAVPLADDITMPSPTLCRRSLRLKGYDYSQGAYFVTVCAANRKCQFGRVLEGEMILSEEGKIVIEEWLKTPALRPHVQLDRFIVMPNHFHGILVLDADAGGTARRAPTIQRFAASVVGSLPTLIRAFKAAVTNHINSLRNTPDAVIWQRNYYEHVIRNEESLNRIREYIAHNPSTWEFDRDNPQRQGEDSFYRWLASFRERPDKTKS